MSGPLDGARSLAQEFDQLDAIAALFDEPFDLVGTSLGAPIAAAWAAAHPSSVRRLVLYGGWATGSKIADAGVRDHILGLVEWHWGLGSDVLTDIFAPDASASMRKEIARYQRACSSAQTARDLLALGYALDVRDALAEVKVPTLVVHREKDRAAPVAQAEVLATGIPGAELVVLPGRSHLPYVGDTHELTATIQRFLGVRPSRRGARVLTPRQNEVAALVGEGRTNREIAERLGITERSAEGHVERIRERLGFTSRAQIAAWSASQRNGLEPPK